MKHIKKGKKFVCAVCSKEFTHSTNLKLHTKKKHHEKDRKAKQIDPELVIANPIKKPKPKAETRYDRFIGTQRG